MSAPGHAALVLLGVAVLALAGLAVAGLVASRAAEERRRVAARLEMVLNPLARVRAAAAAPSIARADAALRPPLSRRAALLFGFDPRKTERYPLPWWVVLPAALIVARIGAGLGQAFAGPVALAAIPPAMVVLSRSYFGWADARHRQRLLVQMPDALAMIVRAVRVGIPVAEAIRAVSQEAQPPTSGEFARLHEQVLIGIPLEQGLRELGERTGLGEYRFFATAIGLQQQTGGGLTDVLDNLADVIRKRVALQSRGKALSSEARTSALVLAVLPVATGGMIAVLEPSYMGVLLTNPTGRALLGFAALSLGIGVLAMRTIIQRTLA